MRIAVITDIHEDYSSLKRAIKQIERLNCNEIICLGDICGFSVPYYNYYIERNASECINLVQDNCKYSIIGNHDLYAIRKLPEEISNFEFPKNWYEMTYHEKKDFSEDKVWLYEENELNPLITNKNIEYLQSLKEYIHLDFNNISLFFSHYIYPDITGSTKKFLFNSSDFSKHYEFANKNNSNNILCVFGHMHPNGIIKISNKEINVKKRSFKINSNILGLSVPCITRNSKFNGFTIIDTNTKSVSTHYLKKFIF